jgi:CubicO group peptidase (beta-lactamase class C family)
MRRRDFLARATTVFPLTAVLREWPPVQRGKQQTASSLGRLTEALEASIPDWLRGDHVPGLSIVIVDEAAIGWQRGFGVRDAASNSPVTPDVMFEAASMSKPVFAYVVMKLSETGVIDLDTPLTKYTADRFLQGDPRLDAITARHVLSHTSGFQNWRSEKDPLAIHFTPGTQYLYSGEGYNYLQTVVTKLLGQPFESYMKARLFAPFGMSSSRYVSDDVAERQMARPHDRTGAPLDNRKSTAETVARYGSAGALLTTPADFAMFLLNVIAPRPADQAHLKPSSVAEMLRGHVKVPAGEYSSSWALGWQIFHNKTGDFIFHGGDNLGFHCCVVASVAARRGYVAMTNGENGPAVLTKLNTNGLMQAFLTGNDR